MEAVEQKWAPVPARWPRGSAEPLLRRGLQAGWGVSGQEAAARGPFDGVAQLVDRLEFLPLPQPIVAVPEVVDALQSQLDRGAVEEQVARPEPLKVALEMMGQAGDRVETNQRGRALDRMDQSEGFADPAGVTRLRLQREQERNELVTLLARFVDIDAEEFRHVIGGHVLIALVAVSHGGDLSGFLVDEVRTPLEAHKEVVRAVSRSDDERTATSECIDEMTQGNRF